VRRIRVMHVIRSLAIGGTENGVRKLLDGLNPERFEQTVCILLGNPNLEVAAGTKIVSLKRSPDRAAFLVPQLARVFASERPDIVHSRNWGTIEAIAAAKLAHVSAVVHSEHGRDLQTIERQPWRRRILRRLFYGWANRVFCVSQELREHYSSELRLPVHFFGVIPNGVDMQQFRPNLQARTDVRRKLQVKEDTLVIGTVSRLDPIKDHRTLFLAAEMALRRGLDLRLVVVGEGTERAALEQDLATRPTLSCRALMVGEVANVADWLNGLDVFVLPSLSEGMSNTLLEAMAVGVPAIATRVGGNPEVIEEGRSGLLVGPREEHKICDYLVQLGSAPGWRGALGKNARQRIVSRFSLERMLNDYEEMYCQLLAQEHVSSPALSRA
jgi:sugar transferase (PEP-CTERM/EpsH1 system associated)